MPRRRVLKGLAALALGGGVAVAAERLRSAEARPMDGCHRYPDGSKVCCYPDGNCYRQGPGGD